MKTPINARTLRQHLTYNWWKYLLIIAVAFGLVDLLYTVTAYRSPRVCAPLIREKSRFFPCFSS